MKQYNVNPPDDTEVQVGQWKVQARGEHLYVCRVSKPGDIRIKAEVEGFVVDVYDDEVESVHATLSVLYVDLEALKNHVVLYRDETLGLLDAPLGFSCLAVDADHAQEQCENAYPGCDVVWVWQGPEGVGIEPALQDYYKELS